MTPTLTETAIYESDLLAHLQDETKVNAIRNGKLVEVYYNELTPDERRAAEVVCNNLYGYND